MNFAEIILIAVAVAMDCFAIAVCLGLRHNASKKNMVIVGLYFGLFQTVMPLIGYYAATVFADSIIEYDHWVAFILLTFLGARMIYQSFKKQDITAGTSLNYRVMVPLAVATSIDSLAVGISFAVIHVDIIPIAATIGIVTFVLAMIGLKIGNVFGPKIGPKAEFIGGVILILIGLHILLGHSGVVPF
jgi:putative Mn2+ efflux pump MntP